MGLGGPVWHASVAPLPGHFLGERELRRLARRVIDGRGDPRRGEWEEMGGKAFHLRRRLTAEEEGLVGPVVDVRGTEEAIRRASLVGDRLRLAPVEVLAEELGVAG